MAMSPEERDADRRRMLRRLESAAASAAMTDATDDEIRATVEAGIADGRRLIGARTEPAPPPTRAERPAIDPNSALADLMRATGDL